MSFGFTPSQPRNARDPRMTAPSYSDRFTSTPQYPASPYLDIPTTPSSPFDASGARANFATPSLRREEDDMILDPDTFQIKDCHHPNFATVFYYQFKEFSTHLFSREIHENCVKVIKSVIWKLNTQKDYYRDERDRKEQELQRLKLNDILEKDAAAKKYKAELYQIRIDYEGRCDQLQKQFDNERSGNSELQKTVEALEKEILSATQSRDALYSEISKLKQRNIQVESAVDLLRKEKAEMQNTLETMEKERYDTTQLIDEIAKLKEKNGELEYDGVQIRHELEQECSSKSEMQKSFEISEAALNGKIETLEKRVKELESDAKKVVNQSIDAVKTLAESCKGCVNTVCQFKKQRRDALIDVTEPITATPEKPATETPTNENKEASPSACVSRPRRSTRTVVDYANLDSDGALLDDEELGDVNVSKRGSGKRAARGSARRSGGRGGAKRTAVASAVSEQELAQDDNGAECSKKSKGKATATHGRGGKRGRPRGSRTSAASTRTRKSPAKKTKTSDESGKEETQAVAAEELI